MWIFSPINFVPRYGSRNNHAAQNAHRGEGLDAIVAMSPENVTYVSGFVVPSQSLMRWRHAACIVTADGRISMVAIDMEATTVKAHAGIDDLRIYREFSDDPDG